MTVTPSATDRDLRATVSDVAYAPLRRGEHDEAYTIELRVSFDVAVAKTETGWTVVDRHTGVHGFGESVSDALDDFHAAVAEHLDVLERQDSLSEDLQTQLDYLRSRLSS